MRTLLGCRCCVRGDGRSENEEMTEPAMMGERYMVLTKPNVMKKTWV